MLILIIGLVLFHGAHSAGLFLPGKKEALIAAGKQNQWRLIVTAGSLVGLYFIVLGYGEARQDPVFLYQLPFWMSHLVGLLVLVSFILMVSSMFKGKIAKAAKHPQLLAVKIWAFGHLLVNGDLASLFLFGSFLAWAIITRIAIKRRVRAGLASDNEGGPVRNDIIAVVIGLILYGIFVVWAHEFLIGVKPIIT